MRDIGLEALTAAGSICRVYEIDSGDAGDPLRELQNEMMVGHLIPVFTDRGRGWLNPAAIVLVRWADDG